MKFTYDHDLHIHTFASPCCGNPEQNPERILKYAKEKGLKTVCITDHFWDSDVENGPDWYKGLNFDNASRVLPLPKDETVHVLFGCEADFNHDLVLGIARDKFDKFDFMLVSLTHYHLVYDNEVLSSEQRANLWKQRVAALLDMDLPFHKMGLSHLTARFLGVPREQYREVLNLLDRESLEKLFTKAANKGIGIELNLCDMSYEDGEEDIVLRPYRIAKECGCKFFLGTDSHNPARFYDAPPIFDRAITMLKLTEDDKFIIKN